MQYFAGWPESNPSSRRHSKGSRKFSNIRISSIWTDCARIILSKFWRGINQIAMITNEKLLVIHLKVDGNWSQSLQWAPNRISYGKFGVLKTNKQGGKFRQSYVKETTQQHDPRDQFGIDLNLSFPKNGQEVHPNARLRPHFGPAQVLNAELQEFAFKFLEELGVSYDSVPRNLRLKETWSKHWAQAKLVLEMWGGELSLLQQTSAGEEGANRPWNLAQSFKNFSCKILVMRANFAWILEILIWTSKFWKKFVGRLSTPILGQIFQNCDHSNFGGIAKLW